MKLAQEVLQPGREPLDVHVTDGGTAEANGRPQVGRNRNGLRRQHGRLAQEQVIRAATRLNWDRKMASPYWVVSPD